MSLARTLRGTLPTHADANTLAKKIIVNVMYVINPCFYLSKIQNNADTKARRSQRQGGVLRPPQ